MTAADNADRYDPRAIQDKWQQRWAAMDLFRASDDPADPRPATEANLRRDEGTGAALHERE